MDIAGLRAAVKPYGGWTVRDFGRNGRFVASKTYDDGTQVRISNDAAVSVWDMVVQLDYVDD